MYAKKQSSSKGAYIATIQGEAVPFRQRVVSLKTKINIYFEVKYLGKWRRVKTFKQSGTCVVVDFVRYPVVLSKAVS
jgi:hypothetical protein